MALEEKDSRYHRIIGKKKVEKLVDRAVAARDEEERVVRRYRALFGVNNGPFRKI